MRRTKKAISLLLTLAMVLTMIPAISLVFTEKAQAYNSYSKPYSTEYYYASGTQFIYQLILYYSSSSNGAASDWLSSNGWTDWSGNFNAGDGHSSKYVHSGYKTTTDPTVAIKGILIADGHPTSVSYGGCTYYAVGSGSIAQTPTGGDGQVDLNMGNGGDDLYLMATADRAAGPALTSLTKSQSGNSGTAQNNLTNNGYRIVTDQSGNYQDTNAGAGGDYNYCGQKSSCTTVNSDDLRAAYLSAKNRYENGGSGISGLSTALNTASNILSDLNDGYTTYTQAQINAAAQALNWAVATVSVNTAATFTVSSANTGAYGLYAFTPSASGKYVFLSNASVDTKGWIYTKDTSSSIGLTQITNGYNDDVGSGSDQYTILGLNHYYNHYVKDVTLNAGTTYYLRTQYYSSQAGNYPIYICNAVNLNFYAADNATAVKSYTDFPAGFSLNLGHAKIKDLFTRSGCTQIGWCANSSNIARMESRDYTTTQTITIPTSSTNFAALWSPSSPTTVNANTAYTATISTAYTIQYYKFTPSTTRKYKFYATASGLDTYGVMYEPSAWANSATILDYDDDAAGNSQFAKTRQLTAGTAYLLGVKCYGTNTGSVPFRIDEIYNITYNANGGSGAPSAQEKQYGVALTLSSTQPTRNGYTFRGWATSSGATSAAYAAGASYTGNADLALYAVWEANQYGIAFNVDGGETVNDLAYKTNENKTLPSTTKAGYTLSSWKVTTADGSWTSGATFTAGTSVNGKYGNPTLTAQWTGVPYSVRFNGNGATSGTMSNESFVYGTAKALTSNAFSRSHTVTYKYKDGRADTSDTVSSTFAGWATTASGSVAYSNGQSVSTLTTTANATVDLFAKWNLGSVTLPTPTRTGYTFGGWYTNEACTEGYKAGGSSFAPSANTVLYAKWAGNSYSVTFNGNGATSGSMNPQNFIYGVSQNLTANAFGRAYTVTYNGNGGTPAKTSDTATATFNGWATSASGAKVYNNGQSVTDLTGTAGGTFPLYANWTLASVTLPTATREGYTFSGWYTAASGGSKYGDAGAGYQPTANVTMVAQWAENGYQVRFNGNGATSGEMANQSYTFSENKALSDNQFQRKYTVTLKYNDGGSDGHLTAAYTFAGWTLNEAGSGTVYSNEQVVGQITQSNGEVVDLYAQWTPASVSLITPYWNAYTFHGWYTDSDCTEANKVNGNTFTPTADITLYAKRTANNYTITFDAADGQAVEALGYKMTDTTPLPSTGKTGYSFAGWKVTVADGNWTTGSIVAAGTSVKNKYGSPTLTAQWTPVEYTVILDVDGIQTVDTYTTESEDVLPEESKTGYIFQGWKVTANDGNWTETTNLSAGTPLAGRWGNVALTAQWEAETYACEIVLPEGASLDGAPLSVKYNGTYSFTVTLDEAHNKTTPTVTATNADVSQIREGDVIRVTLSNITGQVEVDVPLTLNTYALTIEGDEGFTVNDSVTTTTYGSSFRFTVALSEGYTQTAPVVTLDGAPLTAASVEGTSYTYEIDNVTADATVSVTATINTYAVTLTADDGAQITSDASPVTHGEDYHFSVTPKTGYTQTAPAVTVNGETLAAASVTEGTYNYVIPAVNETKAISVVTTLNTYTVIWKNENGTVLETDENVPHGAEPAYDGETPVKAADAQYTYSFNGWDNALAAVTENVTYTATYTSTVNQYTVTFVDEDGAVLLAAKAYDYGTPADQIDKPDDPTKEADAQYTYTFAGWGEIAAVTENVTYTASYSATVNQYTVTFKDEDGSVLSENDYEYGTHADQIVKPDDPTKAATQQYTYTFAGWGEIADVTEDATYTASYSSTVNQYTVTFVDEDGTVLKEAAAYDYGTPADQIVKPDDPTKEATAQYTYTFAGWGEIAVVTEDVTYTASYSATVNQYTVTFVDDDGTVLKEAAAYDYGTPADQIAKPDDPTKEATQQYTYTFAGWGEIANVTENATYTASYTSTVNQYTVTFVDEDGAILLAAKAYDYGTPANQIDKPDDPTKDADAQYTYTFAGWGEIADVTDNITYTASYTSTVNQYTVTFVDEDGTVLKEAAAYDYGTPADQIVKPDDPTKEADAQYTYTFAGWGEIAAVTEDVTYTASYSATVNKYTVTFKDEDGSVLSEADYDYGTQADQIAKPDDPTKEADAQFTYTFTGWGEIADVTDDATYTASYSATVNKYTVTFKDEDGSVLSENDYEYGTPADQIVKPDDPTKAATQQYTYTFAGWGEIANVTENATYTASYTSTVNQYTVTFVDEDDTVLLETKSYDYGTPASDIEKPAEPTKQADAANSYAFNGWDPAVADVTDNVTYKATYTSTINKYKVTFLNDNGDLLMERFYDYGTLAANVTLPDTPTKERTQQYTYTFAAWDKAIADVTEDATYVATYDAAVNQYTVTFVDEDGETVLLETKSYDYGTSAADIEKPADPTKPADAQYTYTFAGWGEIADVTDNVTYTASYTGTLNSYDISFFNYNNVLLDKQTLEYGVTPVYGGETPEKPADAQFTYTFAGWDPEITTVTETAEYVAVFDSTVNSYTVKFINYDGELLQEETQDYGTTPEYKGETPVKEATAEFSYTFTGWDKEISSVTGDETYIAMFDNITNSYTVKFVNYDGALLQEETLLYGADPEYKGETPVKAATAQYTYTFAGWDSTIGRVTDNATYTATFSSTVNTYTITFVDENGETVLDSQVLPYGNTPVYGGTTPAKAADAEQHYSFAGFGEIVSVIGPATYTAVYTGAAHEWNGGSVTRIPTCATVGEKLYTCGVCGKTKTETLDKDPANHAGGTETRGYIAPTEEENGYSGDVYCKGCDELLESGHTLRNLKGHCIYCGGYHEGVLGAVITAFHGIIWLFHKAFNLGNPFA